MVSLSADVTVFSDIMDVVVTSVPARRRERSETDSSARKWFEVDHVRVLFTSESREMKVSASSESTE